MIYRNVICAVVRALACETIIGLGGCRFEPRVQNSRFKGEFFGSEDALLIDYMVHKVLHAQLSPRHWSALTARYSTDKIRKLESIGKLVAMLSSPAPYLFTQKAVTAWAVPQVKGIRREKVRVQAPGPSKQPGKSPQSVWRDEAVQAAVVRANVFCANRVNSRSNDLIILADSNYDMTTWDNQGLTDRTYQRWNKAIKNTLEGLVNEALVEAQSLLEQVGVLVGEAA